MKKPGDGGEGGVPQKPQTNLPVARLSSATALFLSTALAALGFLSHIFLLFLVEPLKYLRLSKESAYAYSSIPLCFGVIFFLTAIYNFRKIEERSVFHILSIIVAFVFGTLSIQGLAGVIMFLMRRSYG